MLTTIGISVFHLNYLACVLPLIAISLLAARIYNNRKEKKEQQKIWHEHYDNPTLPKDWKDKNNQGLTDT